MIKLIVEFKTLGVANEYLQKKPNKKYPCKSGTWNPGERGTVQREVVSIYSPMSF